VNESVRLHPFLLTAIEIYVQFMGELQGKRGIKGGRGLPDSAEKGEVFRKRALQWWDTDIKTLIPSSESSPDLTEDDTPTPTLPLRVLIVSHGAFIHTLVDALRNDGNLQHLPHLEVNRPRIYNTSISEIRYDSNGKLWTLWRYADINHLLTPSNVVKDNADETG
jgi:broad specificity phosphatase PhoE